MGQFIALIVFTLIGSTFGPLGFFIGLGIGIGAWILIAGEKNKLNKIDASLEAPLLSNKSPTVKHDFFNSVRSVDVMSEYKDALVRLYSTLLFMYPASDRAMVNTLTELVKSDGWIGNKYQMLDEMLCQLETIQIEFEASPMMHQLHSNSIIERTLRLPKAMRTSLALQMESLLDSSPANSNKEGHEYIANLLQSLRKDLPVSNQRAEAETLIMQSGDQQAINILREMKRNPSQYQEMFKSGIKSNTVLKTAFGVFTGMLAAEAVKAAVSEYQKQQLLSNLDEQIQSVGGLEHIEVKNDELAVISELPPSFDEPSSSDKTDEMGDFGFSNEPEIDPVEDDFSSNSEEDSSPFSSAAESPSVVEIDSDETDNDFSLDIDD